MLGYNLADGSLDGKLSRRSFLSKSFECDRAIIQITEIKVECNPRGVLPSDRLMGMCRWMGSHFHGWIDYNEVAFSLELLEWDRTFSGFGG